LYQRFHSAGTVTDAVLNFDGQLGKRVLVPFGDKQWVVSKTALTTFLCGNLSTDNPFHLKV
jgi:hypothetical protein